MSVLDASIVIALLNAHDSHHDEAWQLLDEAVATGQAFLCSPITLAEILVGPVRLGHLDRATTAIDEMGIESVPLPVDAPSQLATLRAGTGLKLPDCCVLLAGQQNTDHALLTFDARLAKAAQGLGLPVAGDSQ